MCRCVLCGCCASVASHCSWGPRSTLDCLLMTMIFVSWLSEVLPGLLGLGAPESCCSAQSNWPWVMAVKKNKSPQASVSLFYVKAFLCEPLYLLALSSRQREPCRAGVYLCGCPFPCWGLGPCGPRPVFVVASRTADPQWRTQWSA